MDFIDYITMRKIKIALIYKPKFGKDYLGRTLFHLSIEKCNYNKIMYTYIVFIIHIFKINFKTLECNFQFSVFLLLIIS